MRDRMADGWKFSEPGLKEVLSTNYGSGYPSDPKCKAWMEELHDPVFGYSDVLRFSWAPTKKKLLEKGVPVTFKADLDDADEVLEQQKGMTAFLGKKRKRLGYFEKRNLEVVTKVNLN
jgi:ribonuclease H2 subunit A